MVLLNLGECLNSSVVEQGFCKAQVAGSNPVSGSSPSGGMVDTQVLGTCVARREGSSPFLGIL